MGDGEADTHTYQCVGCRKRFVSTAASADAATCPDCGGEEVRVDVGGRDDTF
ncbi:MAG: hypothetical protein ABEH77_11460 [Halobacteriaceae archaeon]